MKKSMFYDLTYSSNFHIIEGNNNWFLPSKDELNAMYTELKVYGVGNFADDWYWSSSEDSSTTAWNQYFVSGAQINQMKHSSYYVRACRAFTSATVYSLRDIGPSGGFIFYKNGDNYIEAAPTDQTPSPNQTWSNIEDALVTGTATAIGTGQTNTTSIINQVGHTASAAKLCDDLTT
jgi:hypothetical protein